MERLSGSPRIVDLYGHCGTSVSERSKPTWLFPKGLWRVRLIVFAFNGLYQVIVEAIPYEVEEYIVPEGYVKQVDLHDADDVKPQNSYSAAEKLGMALEMAESLADLHGFPDGVMYVCRQLLKKGLPSVLVADVIYSFSIFFAMHPERACYNAYRVHDDVQLCQWLRLPSGKLKLGDFNRAEIMTYNVEKQQYCKYNNGRSYGNVSCIIVSLMLYNCPSSAFLIDELLSLSCPKSNPF